LSLLTEAKVKGHDLSHPWIGRDASFAGSGAAGSAPRGVPCLVNVPEEGLDTVIGRRGPPLGDDERFSVLSDRAVRRGPEPNY
jgi:hypothetical protein